MRLNILKLNTYDESRGELRKDEPRTHEGAPTRVLTAEQSLRRAVLSCMLWEREFYEDDQEIATRICTLVPQVAAEQVAALAIEARECMHLRHVPLLLVREMARHATHRVLVGETLSRVIQRADELSEFLAIYWAEGRQPLSAQVKKGLAAAFVKFDEYALAKYDRDGAVRLRDVLFLTHARPLNAEQEALWKRLVEGQLATPDTWEVAVSSAGRNGESKQQVWERLLAEHRLGALALLRNLRNMHEAQVREELVLRELTSMRTERILPFRYLAAARNAPQWEEVIELAMIRSLVDRAGQLAGHTVLLVDVSGSMNAPLSRRSEMQRTDAAYGLAILLRELAERVTIYTFSDASVRVPNRRGMALRDALEQSQPHGATYLGAALRHVEWECPRYERLIVLTDEQSHDKVTQPNGRGYMINVASSKNGVGYPEAEQGWMHIDGFSEAIVDYILALEGETGRPENVN